MDLELSIERQTHQAKKIEDLVQKEEDKTHTSFTIWPMLIEEQTIWDLSR